MGTENKRLFIGNLPDGVNEEMIMNRFSKYGNVHSVELKQRRTNNCFDANMNNDDDDVILSTFAFIDISSCKDNLDRCLKKLSRKKWNGREIKIEFAKESALSRLERERAEFSNINSKSTNKPVLTNTGETDQLKENGEFKIVLGKNSFGQNRENVSKKPKNTSKKDGFNVNSQFINRIESSPVSEIETNTLSSEQRRIKSLEEKNKFIAQRKLAVKAALTSVDTLNTINKKIVFKDSDDEMEGVNFDINDHGSSDRNHRAVPFINENSRNNLFEDTDASDMETDKIGFEVKEQFEGAKGKKLLDLQTRFGNDSRFMLDERFIENSDNEDEYVDGKNNQNKINYINDADDDKMSAEEGDENEVSRQLKILQSVVGYQITKPSSLLKSSKKHKRLDPKSQLCVRFDPSIADHEKFIVKHPPTGSETDDSQKTKKNKKKTKTQEDESEAQVKEQSSDDEKEKVDVDSEKVTVSKETFYEVATDLKERLRSAQSDGNTFSLSQLFGSGDTKTSGNAEYSKVDDSDVLPSSWTNKKTQLSKHVQEEQCDRSDNLPLKTTSSTTATITSTSSALTNLWKESFFFKVNDDRFKEAVEFFSRRAEVKDSLGKFAGKRQELKRIVKKKVQRNMQQNKIFKKKLGGFSNKPAGKNFKRRRM